MFKEELNSLFETMILKNYFQGIQWSIKKDNISYAGKVGFMDLDNKDPIREDSIYRIWSMTKPIVAIATMILVERGQIDLEDPIESYLPQAKKLKVLQNKNNNEVLLDLERSIKIKDLLLHTAGFSYNFLNDPIGKEYEKNKIFHSENSLLKNEVEKILTFPLLFQPGKNWVYSVSIDVCVPISKLVECIQFAESEIQNNGLKAPMVGHVGDGNFHVTIVYDPKKENEYKYIRDFSNKLIDKALELEGTITGEHGIGLQKKDYLLKQHPDNIPLMKIIKNNFDPNNILNPGKVFDL